MATEKGEGTPGRPPIPGDLPYREPPVIEGKAEEVHERTLDSAEPAAEASAAEPSGGSMDELRAAMESALESDPSHAPPPESSAQGYRAVACPACPDEAAATAPDPPDVAWVAAPLPATATVLVPLLP